MNKIIITVLVAATLITGCSIKSKILNPNTTNEQTQNSNNTLKNEDEQKLILEKFDAIKGSSPEKDILTYINSNLNFLSKDKITTMVLTYENIQRQNYSTHIKKFLSTDFKLKLLTMLNGDLAIDQVNNLPSSEIKNYLSDLLNSGYSVVLAKNSSDSFYYLTIDYSYYKKYDKYLSNDINNYYLIMYDISKASVSLNNGSKVSLDDIFNIVNSCDVFIKQYPNSLRQKDVKGNFIIYLKYFLLGSKNFSPFNQDGFLSEDAKKIYLSINLNKSDSILSSIMKDYLPLLKKHNYELNSSTSKLILQKLESYSINPN